MGSIPEAKTGVTGNCILALILEMEKMALKQLIGHCTESAAYTLNGLKKLGSTSTLITQLPGFNFISLPINGVCFLLPYFSHILPYHIIQAGVF